MGKREEEKKRNSLREKKERGERKNLREEIELIDYSYNTETDELFLTIKSGQITYPYKINDWIS